ncbi:hypothetical protein IMSHALPRED_007055 [Imshaugia aleurites]|uniref:Uncharacterized protein n=1 Tax=Imshaugia aleurites TaxID=172621 RepID=A0A8H3FN15_9LECA|nr:hypothetical protein IMSHALPRED_007055 [Imshaugia aleurites]
MSSRRHLRNRKRIKAPSRFNDADDRFNDVDDMTSSPRQEPEEESEESSDLQEETYSSPKPKKPKATTRAYRGEVIEFNPNLPPAAFPTLDHPGYVHNGGSIPIDLESHLSGGQSREPSLAGFEGISSDSEDRSDYREGIDHLREHRATTPDAAAFPRRESVMQTSMKGGKAPRPRMFPSLYGGPTDNGPRNPIWASNMARMEEAGRMTDLDRNILDMESSDEEGAAIKSKRLAGTPSVPEIPAWDDLTVAHKLDLADAIGELHPDPADPAEVMRQLRLDLSQKKELVEFLIQRQDRAAKEEANQKALQEQTQDILLQGGRLSQSTFHQMAEENLYGSISEDDHLQTTGKELMKARAYLGYCGFDPALADVSWEWPSISNAASVTKSRPTQSKSKASLSSNAAQNPLHSPEKHVARRPALPTQEASYPPDPRLGLMHKDNQGATHQHRPTATTDLIAQHSPAAPLSKAPVQSYRVAPGGHSAGLRANFHSTARMPQATNPASPEQLNASTRRDLRSVNKALPKANGASSVLSKPQENHSLPAGSHSLAPTGLPTARKDQKRQSSEINNAGGSALQETAGVAGNGDSVIRKKRKKVST